MTLPEGCELRIPRSHAIDQRTVAAVQALLQSEEATADRVRRAAVFEQLALVVSLGQEDPDEERGWQEIHGAGFLAWKSALKAEPTAYICYVSVDELGRLFGVGAEIVDALVARAKAKMAPKVVLDIAENPGVSFDMCISRGFKWARRSVYELVL